MSLTSTLWSWCYRLSGFLVFFYAISCFVKSMKRTPMKKLKFIENAVRNGNTTLGKVSSYITYGSPTIHEVEYAYSVNGKVYFTTYILHHTEEKFNPTDEMQPGDGVTMQIPSTVTVYYDAARPQKTVLKSEVFAGPCFIKWQKTKKKNKYRDIYKDWVGPVRL